MTLSINQQVDQNTLNDKWENQVIIEFILAFVRFIYQLHHLNEVLARLVLSYVIMRYYMTH